MTGWIVNETLGPIVVNRNGVGWRYRLLKLRMALRRFGRWLRWGTITSKVTGTAGDNVSAEIEYYDRWGRLIGFWAYGYWDPNYPYQG